MITLHYYPGNASLLPHMLLREAGADFKLALVDRKTDAQLSSAYRKLNPSGRIPAIEHDGLVLFETAAVAIHIADAFPDSGLAPAHGSRLRPAFLRWMTHLSNTPQAEFHLWFYPEKLVGDPAVAVAVKAGAGRRLAEMFAVIGGQLGEGPYLLGETFSAADLYLLMLIRWGRTLPTPLRDVPPFGAYAQRLLARPAVAATFAAEGLAPPFV
jgi:glutathione S-transferase